MIILIAVSVTSTTETFITKGNITTNGTSFKIETEDADYGWYSCSTPLTIPYTIEIQRDVVQQTCPEINYTKIETLCGNNNLSINFTGIDNKTMENLLMNIIPAEFTDMQSWMQETLLPTNDELIQCKGQVEVKQTYAISWVDRYKELNKTMNSFNATMTKENQDLRTQNTTLIVVLLVLSITLGMVIYVKFIQKWVLNRQLKKHKD